MTKTECPNCKKKYVADLSKRPDWEQKLALYLSGKLIQNVWPDATAIQREQLMTGICSDKCWNEYLGIKEVRFDPDRAKEQAIGDENIITDYVREKDGE